MKMTSEEQLQEVLRRRKRMERERQRRRINRLATISAAMFLLLSLSIPFVIRTGVIRNAYSAYGSFLLFSEAGGALLAVDGAVSRQRGAVFPDDAELRFHERFEDEMLVERVASIGVVDV